MSIATTLKRGGLVLFTSPKHIASHRIRLICQAKDLEIEYVDVDPDNIPEELLELTPSGRLPVLIDRDLFLYDERVISEYLDERFPHPALMPIEANARARIRLMSYEIEHNSYPLANALEHDKLVSAKRKKIQKQLTEQLILLQPYFKSKEYLSGHELSLLDCCVLPLLWRLQSYEIELPKPAQSINKYLDFHAKKDYFKRALSKYEMALRK